MGCLLMLGKLIAWPIRIINLPLVAVDKVIDSEVAEPLEEVAESVEEVIDNLLP